MIFLILLIWFFLNEITSYQEILHKKTKYVLQSMTATCARLFYYCMSYLPLRDLQSRFSSDFTFVGSSVSHGPHQHKADQSEEDTERITHYLMSMTQPEATAKARPPPNSQTTVQQGGQPAENSAHRSPRLDLEPGVHKDLPFGRMSTRTMSQCDVESVWSDWSLRSSSTLNTRDEAAFRDGLSALDTTIVNLLKSIQLDQGKMCS